MREEFEKTRFFKNHMDRYKCESISFEDGEYKGDYKHHILIIRLNSGWFMFQEIKK